LEEEVRRLMAGDRVESQKDPATNDGATAALLAARAGGRP